MADHATIVRVARYRPQPGAEEQLREALRALARGLRDVPGLFGAQVCRLSEEPEWQAIVSRWKDEAAMQGTRNATIEALVDAAAGLGQEQRIEHFIAE